MNQLSYYHDFHVNSCSDNHYGFHVADYHIGLLENHLLILYLALLLSSQFSIIPITTIEKNQNNFQSFFRERVFLNGASLKTASTQESSVSLSSLNLTF